MKILAVSSFNGFLHNYKEASASFFIADAKLHPVDVVIDLVQMRAALVLTVILTTFSGAALIVLVYDILNDMLRFLMLAALAIVAAIAYTVGKKPYGYPGSGDIAVMIFFGLPGVISSQYLQIHLFTIIILPAIVCGLLATAVLNINNMATSKPIVKTVSIRWRSVLGQSMRVAIMSCC